jgi:hypothetical protein
MMTVLQIRKLLDNSSLPIQLAMSENVTGFFVGEMQVQTQQEKERFFNKFFFIKNNLSREKYIEWLKKADVVLLPYLPERYRCRSSGIFIEVITLGNIPAVSDGTWMADECRKFDLHEVIFQWDEKNLIERLYQLSQNEKVIKKVQIMQKYYLEFHTVKNFADVMRQYATEA